MISSEKHDIKGARYWTTLVIFCLFITSSTGIASAKSKGGHGFGNAGGFSSSDLKPYDARNPENILPKLTAPSTFVISGTGGLPILDGAEAAFPVYSAFASACYKDLEPLNENDLKYYDSISHITGPIAFRNTIYGFEALLDGSVDIFFGASPSKGQQKLAADKGIELELTPIGKEAFVFFVNEENPVSSLSSAQIKDIYSGKLINWDKVGGKNLEIIAYQRPQDSGSQTIMLFFMGATKMQEAPKERVSGPMSGSVNIISSYQNGPAALGYSFRFFVTGMYQGQGLKSKALNTDFTAKLMGKKPRIKILRIDGVEPSTENIANGKYPYVINLYAISAKKTANQHVKPFLKWMQGPQGQELLEQVGYIPIK